MIVGILSDTHGHVARTRTAIDVLRQAGSQAFIHCGDIGGTEVLDELACLRAWVVCGNTDEPAEPLLRHAAELGLRSALQGPLRLRLAGRELVVFHGHEAAYARLIDRASDGREPPPGTAAPRYVFHGHTHVARDVRIGPLRIINPGALRRARPHTVATLDLAAEHVEFWPVLD